MASFSEQVEREIKRINRDILRVFHTSVNYLHNEIQERTPVDTGFLRGTLNASLNSPKPVDHGSPNAIAKASLKDSIFLTFSTNYAMRIEYGFDGADSLGRVYHQKGAGMVRLSSQNWDIHVKKAAREVLKQ